MLRCVSCPFLLSLSLLPLLLLLPCKFVASRRQPLQACWAGTAPGGSQPAGQIWSNSHCAAMTTSVVARRNVPPVVQLGGGGTSGFAAKTAMPKGMHGRPYVAAAARLLRAPAVLTPRAAERGRGT